MRPVSGEALGKDAQRLGLFALATEDLLVERERSALHTSKFRESEITEDLFSVVEFLELDEGVVKVSEQWSKKVRVKMSLPFDGDHAGTNLVFKELR